MSGANTDHKTEGTGAMMKATKPGEKGLLSYLHRIYGIDPLECKLAPSTLHTKYVDIFSPCTLSM